jgi:hypothetical protein
MVLQLDENYKIESDSTAFVLYRRTVPKDETKEPYYIAVSYNGDLSLALMSYNRYAQKDVFKESKDIKELLKELEEIKQTIKKVGGMNG